MKYQLNRKVIFLTLGCTFLYAQDDYSLNSHLSLTGDWMYLRHSKIRNHTLVDDSSRSSTKVMDVKGLVKDFDWESAAKAVLTLIKHDATAQVEVLYYYVWPWVGEKKVHGNGTLSFPFESPSFAADFENADFAMGKYQSQLQNAEFNYWGYLSPRRVDYFSASWILGARFIYLRDKFRLKFVKNADHSNYRIRTRNLLYGLQAGGVFEFNPSRRWTWAVCLKGATFLNDAQDKVFLGDLNDTVTLRNYRKKKWAEAFLIEGIGSLTYQALTHLNIHIGYQAFLATGFAFATGQRDKDPKTKRRIHTRGDLVVDGGFAGLTYNF